MDAAALGGSRTARPRTRWFAVVEAVGLAGLWSALPTYAFATQPPHVQVVIGGAMAAMITAAIALAAIPAAAIAWIATLTARLLRRLLSRQRLARSQDRAHLHAARRRRRVQRRAADPLDLRPAEGASRGPAPRRNSIRLLLNEYEHRGVGWLWQVDAENRVVYISSRMTALLGRSTNQLIGHSLPAALGGTSALGRTLLARQPFANLEMELKTRRGTRWISLAGDPIIDMAGQFQGFRGVGQDVTEVRATQERLTNLANMDVLSGLPNRGRVRQLLGEALSGSAGGETPCAIMFLDLDGFKPVNDTFGHPKGDAVLKSVAQRLVKEVGPFGHVGRMGGDEFAIVIKDAQSRRDGRDARRAAHRRDRRALPHRQGRDPDRRLDRLRVRPGRRPERRRPHPEGRPRALPGQGPGPRHLLLLQRRHAERGRGPAAARAGHARSASRPSSSACSTSR